MSALRLHTPQPDDRPEQTQHHTSAGDTPLVTSESDSGATHHFAASSPHPPTNSTKSWLDVLEKLLPMPEDERKNIRDELASHLRERVRDLTLAGVSESEAVRTAIAELGDAAQLAKSYSNVKSGWAPWARSNVMKIAATSVVVAGLAVGVFALRGSGQQEALEQQRQAEQAKLQAETEALRAITERIRLYHSTPHVDGQAIIDNSNELVAKAIASMPAMEAMPEDMRAAIAAQLARQDIRVSCPPDTTWRGLFESIAKGAGKQAIISVNTLESSLGMQIDDVILLELSDVPLDQAIKSLNEGALRSTEHKLAVRVTENTIAFGTEREFDEKEVETRTFSLDELVTQHLEKAMPAQPTRLQAEEQVFQEVARVLVDIVSPNIWRENGGDLASLRHYGAKIFVVAPGRHFEKIEWVLKEIGAFDTKKAGNGEDGALAPAPGFDNALAASTLAPAPITNRYVLTHAKAAGVRDALEQLFNAAPSLKECDVPRVMSVDDPNNLLDLTATPEQIDVVNKVVALIDKTHPDDTGTSMELVRVTVSNTNADGMVDVIRCILNAVPSLVECNVSRSIYAEPSPNTIAIISTHDQGAIIASIIEGIDNAVGKQIASSGSR